MLLRTLPQVTNSYGWLLCGNFSADCRWEASSGITLETGHPNLPNLFPYTLGAMYSGNMKLLNTT
jgi:hypothetical protein